MLNYLTSMRVLLSKWVKTSGSDVFMKKMIMLDEINLLVYQAIIIIIYILLYLILFYVKLISISHQNVYT
jgi:hypothetical protein